MPASSSFPLSHSQQGTGSATSELRAAQRALTQLFGPPPNRSFDIRLWDGTLETGEAGSSGFTLVIARQGALRRMLLPLSELSLVEAYLRGDVDIEGSVEAATTLGDLVASRLHTASDYVALVSAILALPSDPESPGTMRRIRGRLLRGPQHAPARDTKAVRFHYDVGNDFYKLWLDQRMQYSCAYFGPGIDDLGAAQTAKLEYICRKLRLAPGERLLDIGCGWGGLMLYAAQQHGAEVLGITLSEQQAAEARARIAAAGVSDRCQVEVRDYRELSDTRLFDKVASVGMVEHVGRRNLPVYFETVARLLKPGGLFLNHGIITLTDTRPTRPLDAVAHRLWRRNAFIDRYVFPDGELVPSAALVAAAEAAGFEMRDAESLREHYARTLRHWVSRLERHHDEAIRMTSEHTYRVWRLYMSAAAHAFASAGIGLMQMIFAKPDAVGHSNIPPTREDLYVAPSGNNLSSSHGEP